MRRVFSTLTLAAVALIAHFLAASQSEAAMQIGATVNATFNSQGPNGGSDVTVHLAGDGYFHLSQGGAMDWTFQSGSNTDHNSFSNPFVGIDGQVDVAGGSFVTFCIQVSQGISFHNTYPFTIQDLRDAPQPAYGSTTPNAGMGTTAAMEIKQLWAQYFPTIHTSSDPSSVAAAFQLAIWKLEYDQGQLSQSSVLSALSTDTESQAATLLFSGSGINITATEYDYGKNDILKASAGMVQWVVDHPNADQANLFALVSGSAQDQVGEVPGSGGNGGQGTVPEPATAVMCLMGCACLGVRRSWQLFSAIPRVFAT